MPEARRAGDFVVAGNYCAATRENTLDARFCSGQKAGTLLMSHGRGYCSASQ